MGGAFLPTSPPRLPSSPLLSIPFLPSSVLLRSFPLIPACPSSPTTSSSSYSRVSQRACVPCLGERRRVRAAGDRPDIHGPLGEHLRLRPRTAHIILDSHEMQYVVLSQGMVLPGRRVAVQLLDSRDGGGEHDNPRCSVLGGGERDADPRHQRCRLCDAHHLAPQHGVASLRTRLLPGSCKETLLPSPSLILVSFPRHPPPSLFVRLSSESAFAALPMVSFCSAL
eukprot:1094778-Rhodomonas_salina.2